MKSWSGTEDRRGGLLGCAGALLMMVVAWALVAVIVYLFVVCIRAVYG